MMNVTTEDRLSPNKSMIKQSLKSKRTKRKRPWTARQIDYLEKHVKNSTYTEIAYHLNRHPSSVRYKAIQLGIQRDYCVGCVTDEFGFPYLWHYKRKKWTEEERDFLRANHHKMTVVAIAAHLGRSYNSVYQQLRVMRLTRLRTNKRR